MKARMLEKWWQRVASFGFVYSVLGISSAIISNDLETALVQASIRVGFFLLAIAVFYYHFRVELHRSTERLLASACITSGAVAFGSFLLAAYAVGIALLETSHVPASLLSALLVWPAATGLPALVAALVLGKSIILFLRRTKDQ
ncbi:MAG: hypothetical protein HY962_09240 [Ignavibacteriae bacterium]|nr:hypothetical protein [Ignavibacteriota bacterium]